MEFTLAERFVLQSALPEKGTLLTLKVLEKLRMDLAPSEEEIKKYGITLEENGVRWSKGTEEVKEIEVGSAVLDVIKERFKELDKEKELTMQHLPVLEKLAIVSFE